MEQITTIYDSITHTSTTLYDTYAGLGIMCDNNDIYCDTLEYYCDGAVAMWDTAYQVATYYYHYYTTLVEWRQTPPVVRAEWRYDSIEWRHRDHDPVESISVVDILLLEDGDSLLLEDGDFLELEDG